MLSLIEVTCPHCGAKGQIMLPPVGAIVVGPCPECKGLVVVFCGQVLPLDNDVMFKGSSEEQRDHLMSVLTPFIQDRVDELEAEEAQAHEAASTKDAGEAEPVSRGEPAAAPQAVGRSGITEDEVETFVGLELKLLDNGDYFKAIFG